MKTAIHSQTFCCYFSSEKEEFQKKYLELKNKKGCYLKTYVKNIIGKYKEISEINIHDRYPEMDKTVPGPYLKQQGTDSEKIFFDKLIEENGIKFVFDISKIYPSFLRVVTNQLSIYNRETKIFLKNDFCDGKEKSFWDKNFVEYVKNKKSESSKVHSEINVFFDYLVKTQKNIIIKLYTKNFGNKISNFEIIKNLTENKSGNDLEIYEFQDSIKDFENGSLFGLKNKLSKNNWKKFFKNYNSNNILVLNNGIPQEDKYFVQNNITSSFCLLLATHRTDDIFCQQIKEYINKHKDVLLSFTEKEWKTIIHNKKQSKNTVFAIFGLLNYISYPMENIKLYDSYMETQFKIEEYLPKLYACNDINYVEDFDKIKNENSDVWKQIIENINNTILFNKLSNENFPFSLVEYFYEYVKNKKRYIGKFPKMLLSAQYPENLKILEIV